MKSIEERVAEIQNCTMPETCSRQPRPGSHVTGCRAEMNEEIIALIREQRAEALRKVSSCTASLDDIEILRRVLGVALKHVMSAGAMNVEAGGALDRLAVLVKARAEAER